MKTLLHGKTIWTGTTQVLVVILLILISWGGTPDKASGNGCFGGVLSQDPLHCYVLEEAQRESIIDVEAVFETGRALAFYLRQTEPVGSTVYQYIQRKSEEYVRRSGGPQCVLSSNKCDEGTLPSIGGGGYLLPHLVAYEDVELRPGGADARVNERGWPSYVQVWPPQAVTDGTSGSTRHAGVFDISDVDLTNFPEMTCHETNSVFRGYCLSWRRYPDLGLAGYHDTAADGWFFVKASPGEEEASFEPLKQALRLWTSTPPDESSFIPVEYDLFELWKWSVILDRFALSSGNTIGIYAAEIRDNRLLYYGSKEGVYTAHGVGAPASDDVLVTDKSTLRPTITVWTLNERQTIEALPRLLRQLGIPPIAVSIVVELDSTPIGRARPHSAAEATSSGSTQTLIDAVPDPAGAVESPAARESSWLWMVAAAASAGLVLLGALSFYALRRRKRSGLT